MKTFKASQLQDAISRVSRAMDARGDGIVVISGNTCWACGAKVSGTTPITDSDDMDGEFLARLDASCVKVITLADPDGEIKMDFRSKAKVKKLPKPGTDPEKPEMIPVDFDACTIKTSTGRWNLDVQHGPAIEPPSRPEAGSVSFDAGDFARAIRRLMTIYNDDEMSMNYTGVHLGAPRDGTLDITASDGRRVGVTTVPCSVESTVDPSDYRVIPRHLLAVARPMVDDAEARISVEFSDRHCYLTDGTTNYSGTLLARPFPTRYVAMVLDDRGQDVGTVEPSAFSRALRLASITTNRMECCGVTIAGKPPGLELKAEAPDAGKSIVVTDARIEKKFTVSVDPNYLIRILDQLDTDVRITAWEGKIRIDTRDFRYILSGIEKN